MDNEIDYDKLAEAMKRAEKPNVVKVVGDKAKSFGEELLDGDEGSIAWLIKKIAEWLRVLTAAVSDAISNRLVSPDDEAGK